MRLKILSGSIIFLLLFLLVTSTNDKEHWQKATESELHSGCLGGLTADETKILNDLVQRILPKSSSEQTAYLNINQPPKANHLNIYTFQMCAQNNPVFKQLRPGNAIYLRILDAIYIDIDLVQTGIDNIIPYIQDSQSFYLAMVLAHELGHRELKHGTRGLLDSPKSEDDGEIKTSSQDMEIEWAADDFAVRRLADEMATQSFMVGDVNISNFSEIVPLIPAEKDNNFHAALVTAAVDLAGINYIRPGDYSSFYSDDAHITLTARFRRLIFNADSNEWLPESSSEYIDKMFNGYANLKKKFICEIKSVNPFISATWTSEGLFVLDNKGGSGIIPYASIEKASTEKLRLIEVVPHTYDSSLPTNQANQRVPSAFVEIENLLRRSENDELILISQGGVTMKHTKGGWSREAEAPLGPPQWQMVHEDNVILKYEPTDDFSGEGTVAYQSYDIVAFNQEWQPTLINQTEILAKLNIKKGDGQKPDISLAGIDAHHVYVMPNQIVEQESLVTATLASIALKQKKSDKLNIDKLTKYILPPSTELANPRLILVPQQNSSRVFVCGFHDGQTPNPILSATVEHGWILYEVFENDPPRLIAQRQFLPQPQQLGDDYEPGYIRTSYAGPRHLMISFENEIFTKIINLETGAVSDASLPATLLEISREKLWYATLSENMFRSTHLYIGKIEEDK